MATAPTSLTSGFATVLDHDMAASSSAGGGSAGGTMSAATSYADLLSGGGGAERGSMSVNSMTAASQPAATAAAAPSQQPQQPAFDPTVLHMHFSDPMREVIRFLDTVSRVPVTTPAASIGSTFMDLWSVTGSPATVADMQACLGRLYALTEPQLVGVLARVDPRARAHFHTQVQLLADGMHGDMDELSQASALIRWLMGRGLPALAAAGLPEDAELHTSTVVKQRFKAVEAMCRVAVPDESNPAVAAAGSAATAATKAAKAAQDALADTNSALAAAEARTTKQRTVSIVLGVLLVVVAVVAVVLVVLLVRKKHRQGSGSGGTNSSSSSSGGGVDTAAAVLSNATTPAPVTMPVSTGGVYRAYEPPGASVVMSTSGLPQLAPYAPTAFDAAMAAAISGGGGGISSLGANTSGMLGGVAADDFGFPSLA